MKSAQWPKRFAYMGRYNERKGIPVLIEAYNSYRAKVEEPWELHCYGKGEFAEALSNTDGIVDHGFTQPEDLPDELANAGVFVLPSHFDNWPLVILETCASGLPIICTNSCGSSAELVRDHFNGLTIPPDDAKALSQSMIWMHQNHAILPEMGKRSQQFAAPYSGQQWAIRFDSIVKSILE